MRYPLLVALFTTTSSLFASVTSLAIRGPAAASFYDVLNVPVLLPQDNNPGNGGINPLLGKKLFRSTNRSFSAFCEKRLAATNCTLKLKNAGDNFTVSLTEGKEFYSKLTIEEVIVNPGPSGGINPLRGVKVLEVDDFKLDCARRLHSTSCTITQG